MRRPPRTSDAAVSSAITVTPVPSVHFCLSGRARWPHLLVLRSCGLLCLGMVRRTARRSPPLGYPSEAALTAAAAPLTPPETHPLGGRPPGQAANRLVVPPAVVVVAADEPTPPDAGRSVFTRASAAPLSRRPADLMKWRGARAWPGAGQLSRQHPSESLVGSDPAVSLRQRRLAAR